MALRSPALWMGNPAVQHTAQNDRLFRAGLLRPETGQTVANRPLAAVSGVIAGPAGTMGEVTVLSNTQFTVNPARWVIGASASALGGSYEATNDAPATLAITAQNATQFRRSYFGVWVTDSFVAGSGDDLPHWGLVDGPLAASAPAATLPSAGSLPANFLALGEFLIPPTGQTVTYTPYDLRTGLRGGILPVTATDARGGAHGGQYRDHPTLGLQRWNVTTSTWDTLGMGGDTGWVPMAAGPSWQAGFGPGGAGAYYRIRNGVGQVAAHILRDSGTRTGPAYQMPAAYAPGVLHWHQAQAVGYTLGEFQVTTSGMLTLAASTRTDTGFVVTGSWLVG